jgi:DCN1-like protein 1/2
MQYLTDLGLDLEKADILVPMEIVQSPGMGEMTKDGFVNGWKIIG